MWTLKNCHFNQAKLPKSHQAESMKDNWKNHYSEAGYLKYSPNDFFAQFIDRISARKLLLPYAGDGRNAVYAAQYGWGVDAFDPDEKQKAIAERMADEKFVSINFETADINSFTGKTDEYDLIALLQVQFAPPEREKMHRHLVKYLKRGGRLVIEALSQNQPGGISLPFDSSLLYNPETLENDFMELQIDMLQEAFINSDSGKPVGVIHFVGVRE